MEQFTIMYEQLKRNIRDAINTSNLPSCVVETYLYALCLELQNTTESILANAANNKGKVNDDDDVVNSEDDTTEI